MMRGRLRAALAFSVAGLAAASLHVIVETPGALRDWRQTLPLAALVGALLGAIPSPRRRGAAEAVLLGGGIAVAGLMGFAAAFAIGHGLISGGSVLGAFSRSISAMAGTTGLAAVGAAMLAGLAGLR